MKSPGVKGHRVTGLGVKDPGMKGPWGEGSWDEGSWRLAVIKVTGPDACRAHSPVFKGPGTMAFSYLALYTVSVPLLMTLLYLCVRACENAGIRVYMYVSDET